MTAILVVITSLILVNNARFGGAVLLENLAYDVALSVRQAQVYGIAVQRFGTGSGALFSPGYGMHFDTSDPTTYILFADLDGTGVYDPNSSPSEVVQSTDIESGYKVSDLCVTPAIGSTEVCGIGALDILFKRPEPDAYISRNGIPTFVNGNLNSSALNQSARVVFKAPSGDILNVVVDASGQISVQGK